MVLRSKKLEAKRFKRWITAEVIPTIRRTGGYSMATDSNLQIKLKQQVLDIESKKLDIEHNKLQLSQMKLFNKIKNGSSNLSQIQLHMEQCIANYAMHIMSNMKSITHDNSHSDGYMLEGITQIAVESKIVPSHVAWFKVRNVCKEKI